MKKIIILSILALIVVATYILFLAKPSYDKIASKAEIEGNYALALQEYTGALLKITESIEAPYKHIPNVKVGELWLDDVRSYYAWTNFLKPHKTNEIYSIVEGIKRCTSHVANHNFVTSKKPKVLTKTTLFTEWKKSFVHETDDTETEHLILSKKAFDDTLSLLRIRAMNGFIYSGKLFNLRTAKRVDFTLYPNTSITLLAKPGIYFLICSSEVQFTEGLSGKTWQSPENIIHITIPDQPSLLQMTLKSRVSRTKK